MSAEEDQGSPEIAPDPEIDAIIERAGKREEALAEKAALAAKQQRKPLADPLWSWLAWRCGLVAGILMATLVVGLTDRQNELNEIADYGTLREVGAFTQEEREQREGEENIQLILRILSLVAFPYAGYRLRRWGKTQFDEYRERTSQQREIEEKLRSLNG